MAIVCGADSFNVAFEHAFSRREAGGEDFVCPVPNLLGGVARKQDVVYAEKPCEFQMAPMVHGIAQHARQGLRKFLKFFAVGSVPRAIALLDSVGTHCAPFVMVGPKPSLRDVVPVLVLADFFRVEVAVEVYQRQFLGVVVVELARVVVFEKKIFVYKFFH